MIWFDLVMQWDGLKGPHLANSSKLLVFQVWSQSQPFKFIPTYYTYFDPQFQALLNHSGYTFFQPFFVVMWLFYDSRVKHHFSTFCFVLDDPIGSQAIQCYCWKGLDISKNLSYDFWDITTLWLYITTFVLFVKIELRRGVSKKSYERLKIISCCISRCHEGGSMVSVTLRTRG